MKAVFPSTSVSVIIDDLYVLPPKCILLIILIFQKEKTVNGFVISWLPCVCISTRSERLRRCFHPKWHGTGFHWWPFIYLGSVSSEPYLIFGGFNMHTVKPGSVMSFWSSFFHMTPHDILISSFQRNLQFSVKKWHNLSALYEMCW